MSKIYTKTVDEKEMAVADRDKIVEVLFRDFRTFFFKTLTIISILGTIIYAFFANGYLEVSWLILFQIVILAIVDFLFGNIWRTVKENSKYVIEEELFREFRIELQSALLWRFIVVTIIGGFVIGDYAEAFSWILPAVIIIVGIGGLMSFFSTDLCIEWRAIEEKGENAKRINKDEKERAVADRDKIVEVLFKQFKTVVVGTLIIISIVGTIIYTFIASDYLEVSWLILFQIVILAIVDFLFGNIWRTVKENSKYVIEEELFREFRIEFQSALLRRLIVVTIIGIFVGSDYSGGLSGVLYGGLIIIVGIGGLMSFFSTDLCRRWRIIEEKYKSTERIDLGGKQ